MASRGRGRRGRPRGDGQPPLAFDQQAFIEAMGVAMANAAQENAAMVKGVPVTSRNSRHIILRRLWEEGTRWWLTIGSGRLIRSWRLWRSPPMPQR